MVVEMDILFLVCFGQDIFRLIHKEGTSCQRNQASSEKKKEKKNLGSGQGLNSELLG